jgi:glucose/mannose-6-phosphate isomerase
MTLIDFIKKYDSQNQLDVLKNTHQQIVSAWNNKPDLTKQKNRKFSSIVFCGLGGSAISGDLLLDYSGDEIDIPFKVVRGYNLPEYTDENTLVIISSYSGNTEETLSCFNQTLNKKCTVISITSGGKILNDSQERRIPVVKIKSGFQPRYALGLSFFSLLRVIQELGYVDEDKNVEQITALWQKRSEEYLKENSLAFQIAEQLIGYIPIIYSAEALSSTGYRLKSQLNENSKLHAFHNTIPEMNHNEIIGWESFQEKQLQTKVIYFMDKEYHPQNLKRFQILKEMLAEKKVDVLTLQSNEPSKKVRIMDLIFLSDWISFCTSVLRGFDPSEIDFIHQMKKRLA